MRGDMHCLISETDREVFLMKLKYYGTAAAEGWPALFCTCSVCREARRLGGRNIRTRAQASIDDRLLIDFGPDTYLHTLYHGLRLDRMHSCLITHSHEDHLCLDEIGYRAHDYAKETIGDRFVFYGSPSVCEILTHLAPWARDPDRIAFSSVAPFHTYEIENYLVTPLPASHGIGETPPLICYIYAIEKDGKRILYAHDTGLFPDPTWTWLHGRAFDLISLDCTLLAHRDGKNHMGIDDVLEIRDRLIRIGCGKPETHWVINHFSHNGGILHDELVHLMTPHGIEVAYDGMEILLS